MRTLRLIVLVSAVASTSCGASSQIHSGVPSKFCGHYEKGFEVDSFRPCGLDERWWVNHETDALIRAVTHPDGSVGGEAYVELQGEVGERGSYGHLGAYERELTVRKVILAEPPRKACSDPVNCGD
jgi:hypothetical protein